MTNWLRRATCGVVFALSAAKLFAGGSGLNIVVVANLNSSNSLQLANYYCEKRGVPPQNVLRINWTGGMVEWTKADFESTLRTPLNAMLTSRGLSNQIDYVLLSMDIPYRVYNSGVPGVSGTNGTTSALFYGFKPDFDISPNYNPASCNLPEPTSNSYAGSEGIFRQTPPINATSNSWLAMMLTSSNLAAAKAVVDRGVASDYAFPTQNVYLVHYEGDPLRGIRALHYEDAMFEAAVRNVEQLVWTNTYSPSQPGYQLGSQFGLQSPSLAAGLFAPGAMADNLTSFSGYIFQVSLHTDALDYLNAGATASYGTIIEPCAYYEKFASPRNYFYQSRGFNVAECYYQSLTNPYQGIMVGEPLAAPFALPGSGSWSGLPAGAELNGTTNLTVQFQAADPSRPLQQVDLFVDGNLAQTLTNIAPRQNNQVFLTINGHTTNYIVPASASLKSITTNLTAILSAVAYSNATKVTAYAHGDRIELRSLDPTMKGSQLSVAVSNSIGSAGLLSTWLSAARTNFLDSPAKGVRSYYITNTAGNSVGIGGYLQLHVLRTNGTVVTVAVTNTGVGFNVLAHQLFDAVNTNATLMAADGVVFEDPFLHEDEPWRTFVFGPNDHAGEFNIRARSPGWPEAQVRVALSGSAGLNIQPAGTNRLDENLPDLYPRNHLYLTAGLTNLSFGFGFNTTTQADGFHELTAVAYEGSHVRTQTRTSQSVRIQNSPLAAVFTCLVCDTNTALEATLQFSVAANTNTISHIELFSTGGSWGVVSNLQTAVFSLAATNLGLGLHPFYSVVTRNDGKQYRTETKWIRLLGNEPPFAVSVSGEAPTLVWPATAGRRYEILSALGVTNAFALRDAVVPTNSPGYWSETNNAATNRFYRVRSAP